MPSPLPENQSRPATSHQHRNQLLWTGAVAILLGIVALQQASSPVSSTVALITPESSLTGIPVLDSPFSLSQFSEPKSPPAFSELTPTEAAPLRLNAPTRSPSSSDR